MAGRETSFVRDVDLGYNDFQAAIEEAKNAHVDIGLLREKFPDPKDVMYKGIIGEFGARFTVRNAGTSGSRQLDIPARPTHRPAFDANWRRYLLIMIKHIRDPTRMDIPDLLKFLGKLHALRVRRHIRRLKNPPNALFTVKKKESMGISPPDDPLIESGDMSRDIDWRFTKTKRGRSR